MSEEKRWTDDDLEQAREAGRREMLKSMKEDPAKRTHIWHLTRSHTHGWIITVDMPSTDFLSGLILNIRLPTLLQQENLTLEDIQRNWP
jgi:hypothetical protein